MGLAKGIGADIAWAVMRLSETATRSRGTAYAVMLGRGIGSVLWRLAGVLLRRRKRLSLANVAVVLPDVPPREGARILREAVLETVSFWPELVSYAYFGTHRILRTVAVEGRENLLAALAKGRGVIAPSIHLGNFSLIGIWMTQADHEFYFLMRYPHDMRIVRRFVHLRRLLGIGAIHDLPRRACVRGIFEALRKNAVIFMQLDQRSSGAGVDVEYFARPFHAFTGPVAIALKTGAAMVPMYIVRENGIRQRLVIEPELEIERTGDRHADVKANLQRLMHRFEGWVREHPEHYWWFHRLWRAESETRAN